MDSNSTPLPTSASSSFTSLVLLGSSDPPHQLTQPTNNITTFPPPSESPVRRPAPSQPLTIYPSDPNLQASIAQSRNDNPSSAIPIPIIAEGIEDIAATLVGSRQSGDGIFTPPLPSTSATSSSAPASTSGLANNPSTLAFARGEGRRGR